MNDQRQGHLPTLFACFLHFDLSFMLWVLIGALGIVIAEDLQLSAGQRGVLVALPILSGLSSAHSAGSLERPLGRPACRRHDAGLPVRAAGGRLAGGWLLAGDDGRRLDAGHGGRLIRGGAAARERDGIPAKRQGLVMGIAAAGNSGTVITNLVAPRLAEQFGWQGVFGIAMVPLAIVLATFLILAREAAARN